MRGAGGLVAVAALLLAAAGCVRPTPPAPAEIRTTPPPWAAPRDAVSHIDLAGLPQLPLDTSEGLRRVRLRVLVDGRPVTVPPYVGVDRLRAVQAAAHTHDDTGTVYLEGTRGAAVTLGQFFTLWGVRLDGRCLGATCGRVTVTGEGGEVGGDPRRVPLDGPASLTVAVAATP